MRFILPMLMMVVGCTVHLPTTTHISQSLPDDEHLACDHETQHDFEDAKAVWSMAGQLEWPIAATVHVILDHSFLTHFQAYGETPSSLEKRCLDMLRDEIFPVFERDLRVVLEIGEVKVWLNADPYSTERTHDGRYKRAELVGSVARWAQQEWDTVGAVVICFSAKRMDGGAVGVASGTACKRYGAGITLLNKFVAAHEIAHQFFIGHDLDNEPDGPFIMARSVNRRNKFEFSPRSLDHLTVSRVYLECLEVVQTEPPVRFPNVPFLRGDVNGDMRWNITDVNALFQYLFNGGKNFYCDDACDVNDDGRMNLVDVTFLFNYLYGKSPKPIPPPPVAEPGIDPTEDNLTCTREAA